MLRFMLFALILLAVSRTPLVVAQPECVPDAESINVLVTVDGLPLNAEDLVFDYDISINGNQVIFASEASNLVTGDTDYESDIFVYERHTCTITRISLNAAGEPLTYPSRFPVLSGDGRFAAFETHASDLDENDTNIAGDIFVRNLQAGTTIMASIAAYENLRQREAEWSFLSADGRYVLFASEDWNFVEGDTNDQNDLFMRDTLLNETTRLSIKSDETQFSGASYDAIMSANGRYVIYSTMREPGFIGFVNRDLWRRDLLLGETMLVSLAANGKPVNDPSVSGNAISTDGRFIVFSSGANHVTRNDAIDTYDIFLRDVQARTTRLISKSPAGKPANGNSFADLGRSTSDDGRLVAFLSEASNLIPNDNNDLVDAFIYDRLTDQVRLIPRSLYGISSHNDYFPVSILLSPDGSYAAIVSGVSAPAVDPRMLYLVRLPDLPDALPTINVYDTLTPTLTWGLITWAVGYEVQVDDDPAFGSPVCCIGESTGLFVETTPLIEGKHYYWRVRALNAGNLPGAWSRVEEFVINAP